MKNIILEMLSKVNNKIAMYVVGIISFLMAYFFMMNYFGFSNKAQFIILTIAVLSLVGYFLYTKHKETIAAKLLESGLLKSEAKTTLEKMQDDYIKTRMHDVIKTLKTSSLGI